MRLRLITVFLLLFVLPVTAQNDSVEKSLFNIQAGFLGTWASHEVGLSNTISVKGELGLNAAIFGDYNNSVGFLLAPVIGVEPRWYYNIHKRFNKGKHTANNSANFVTLAFTYHPDLFVISGTDNIYVPDQITVIPKWGIRRSLFKSNFHYEVGIGIGYRQYFLKQYGYKKNADETALDLHLRIGYTF
ncbi:hypothetical protein E0W68_13530 [Flavobacterium salilacus subsp. salilacus]|uniref:hypothetical protein n=1 Tax=Flavobacterium TaxID=237 RepID=UPI0010756007|nr:MULTISPECIES: hypothetical protein [Flavobacterium]KAF2514489.1 hypothetical protein E0W68_13530 [Flavobacterium salilacus subsp. salilacus]MBE1615918.1 hypothetical protein [Flavobacterium sp. SaA2.13]